MAKVGLKRSLGVGQGTALAVGAVLGPGVLVLPALTARIAGPGVLLAWGAMALFGLSLAVTLGRVGAHAPHAGGVVSYIGLAFGPQLARMSAWWLVASVPLAVSVIALIGANYVTTYLGLHQRWSTVLAALVLGTSCWLNARGLRTAGRAQAGMVAVIAATLGVVTLLAAPRVTNSAFVPFLPHGWVSVAEAALLIFWSYIGFEMVVHLAEEFRRPSRDLPLSMGLASMALSTLYCAAAVVTVGTGVYLVGSGLAPMSVLAEGSLGPVAGVVVALLALCCAFVAVHANVAGFSRLLYARARDGELPRALARLHGDQGAPAAAVAAQAVFFTLILAADAILAPDLAELIAWPSTTFVALYLLGAAAAFRILPNGNVGRVTAAVTFVVCLVILPFGGWACLYPLAVLVVAAGINKLRVAKAEQ